MKKNILLVFILGLLTNSVEAFSYTLKWWEKKSK